MHLTTSDARSWVSMFPRHPIFWLIIAGALVVVIARRMQPPGKSLDVTVPATVPATDVGADRSARATDYAWLSKRARTAYEPLVQRIPAPTSLKRVEHKPSSFGDWLRHLPCLPLDTPVMDGQRKIVRPADDPAIAAVIDLPATNRNLLNAANMAVRLRAEYLWTTDRMTGTVFTFTNGDEFPWSRFAAGERPIVQGRNVEWKPVRTTSPAPAKGKKPDRSTFSSYLETLFAYSSSISLERDTTNAVGDVEAGDLFLVVGRPGHAVVVLDIAVGDGGARYVLLGEGNTPPQTFHVLRSRDGSPWYKLDRDMPLDIPTWSPIPWTAWRRWWE